LRVDYGELAVCGLGHAGFSRRDPVHLGSGLVVGYQDAARREDPVELVEVSCVDQMSTPPWWHRTLPALVHSPRRKPTTDDGTVAVRWN
jgi:hypothetical protein